MRKLVLAATIAALACVATPSIGQQPDVSNYMETRLFVQRCGNGELTGRCREILASTVSHAAHYPGACPDNLPSDAEMVEMVWNYMKYRASMPTNYDTVVLSVTDALAQAYYCSSDW